ncbi:purine and uridine phosphorylase [Aspergillus nidulans var. acristatus]
MAPRKLDHDAYTVGWVCALDYELNAARALLDEEDEDLEPALHDGNLYLLGRFEKHNVVITSTSGYGTNAATQAVTNMIRSFPNIRFGLMVGIGGAVPGEPDPCQPMKDNRLGDIVVSEPKGNHGGVLNYDMGKWRNDKEFSIESRLNSPPSILRQAVTQLRLDHRFRKGKMLEYTEQALDLLRGLTDTDDASFPGWDEDRLFRVNYEHVNPTHEDCRECDSTQIVERSARTWNTPVVYYGLIASGNAVMRSATLRDRLRDAWGVKCFEMEAAGLMNHFPCLVIRGLCDYSDSHKSKRWQAYAAVVAAAYAKDLLRIIGLDKKYRGRN